MRINDALLVLCCAGVLSAAGADQTVPGAGNSIAEAIGTASPQVQAALQVLLHNANEIRDSTLRTQTLNGIANGTCVVHRTNLTDAMKNQIVATLEAQGLLNAADGGAITGGVKAGVFPPVLNEGTACPQMPLTIDAAPGSGFGGHHSYPGGLAVHESFNDESDLSLAANYRNEYGRTPVHLPKPFQIERTRALYIDQDIILAAPIWHDWAKMMVFQWNADGTEFAELNFGGAGTTDNNGNAGDSRTGGHHILSIAETMARGLSPEFVITQASAHSAPTLGNEYKVVNWLRAAAIIAQIDPVATGYLTTDAQSHFRLPALRNLGNGVNLPAVGQTNLLIEYQIHNLSDADFTNSIPAVTESQVLLQAIAPAFNYDPTVPTVYNNKFRNVVFANISPERLYLIYTNFGLPGVMQEVTSLHTAGLL